MYKYIVLVYIYMYAYCSIKTVYTGTMVLVPIMQIEKDAL